MQAMTDYDRAAAALEFISPDCGRTEWFRILAAIKALLGEDGRELADEWSQRAPQRYNAADFKAAWKSASEVGNIGPGTLFYEAMQNGYKPEGGGTPRVQTAEEIAAREQHRREEQERAERKAAEAEAKAAALWRDAAPARPDHPYLTRKGIAPTQTLRSIDAGAAARILGYAPQSDGESLKGSPLVVPLKAGGRFVSAELIDGAGRKTVIAGSKVSGAYWAAQPEPEGDGDGLTIGVGEGMATVQSVKAATGCLAVAARSCTNLRAVAEAMRQRYPRARIVILADLGNGEDLARQAAAAVGGLLALPDFGENRPEGAKDFNDLHHARGLETVRKAIGAAQPVGALSEPQPTQENRSGDVVVGQGRGKPRPLTVALKPLPYPDDALPAVLREAVREAQAFIKCPMPLVAASAISVVAVVEQSMADVRRMPGLEGPISCYFLTFGDSGERKSSCDKHFTKPVREWLDTKRENDRVDIAKALAEKQAWEQRCAGLRDSIKTHTKAGDAAEAKNDQQALATELANKPKPYLEAVRLRGEDTPEKLLKAMAEESPSIGILSDEGGNILGGHGMKSDSLMRSLSQYNVFWDGGRIERGRMAADSDVQMRCGRLSLHLMVQESIFRAFNEDSGGLARGSGFLARFNASWPDSTIGTRMVSAAPTWEAKAKFDRRIAWLLDQLPKDGKIAPKMLELSPEAFNLWARYADEVERQSLAGLELHDVKDIAAKSADNAARLAALFQIFEHGLDGPIGADTMRSGIRVASWHMNEARRLLGAVAVPADLVNASRLDAWLLGYIGRGKPSDPPEDAKAAKLKPNEVLTKTVYQFGPGGMRDKARVGAALAELEEQDRAWPETRGKYKLIVVHPDLVGSAP